MIEKIQQKINEKICENYKSGKLTLVQMYHALGEEGEVIQISAHHDRLDIPFGFLSDLKNSTEEGKLTLASSSWGNRELKEDNLEGTCPTINDMHPRSCGYNSVGGPRYDIKMSSYEIVVEAHSAYQEFDGWDDFIDTSFHWETRTFVYKFACDDIDSVFEKLLSHYADDILGFYTEKKCNAAIDKLTSDMVEKLLDE
ncbi:MAG: hypothetical protein HUK15_01765 [Bacteroidales bacterium]|nr:hypothetical protein [Bacteroidales bacterium]